MAEQDRNVRELKDEVWRKIVDASTPEIGDAVMGCPGCQSLVRALRSERARIKVLEGMLPGERHRWRQWLGLVIVVTTFTLWPYIPGWERAGLIDLAATPFYVVGLWLLICSKKHRRSA